MNGERSEKDSFGFCTKKLLEEQGTFVDGTQCFPRAPLASSGTMAIVAGQQQQETG